MQSLRALATNGSQVDTTEPWLYFMVCTTGHVTELDVFNSSVFRVAMDWYVKVSYTCLLAVVSYTCLLAVVSYTCLLAVVSYTCLLAVVSYTCLLAVVSYTCLLAVVSYTCLLAVVSYTCLLAVIDGLFFLNTTSLPLFI
ncbi:hypothetical protein Btru_029974 [Bulinus truncatus]|nr:hypothetical protein Btru_029974 [Bulinus truncatus]